MIGGALGALTRYELGVWISSKWNQGFPYHTFIINITGAFLLGFINILLIERYNVSPVWRMGIGVGFLGAYTTFSTFSYEIIKLIEEGSYSTASFYAFASVLVGLVFVAIGMSFARLV
ncbi:MAG TPA: fluoride efflux transporter CrcB [Peptococcaceae bacterium]|nr:fluoride efflux transporter CrcB [Peptococcaceae bacterium]